MGRVADKPLVPVAPRDAVGEAFGRSLVYGALRSVWETFLLAPKTLRLMVTPPFSWLPDAIVEANLNIRRCIVPLAISQVIWLWGFGVLNFGEVAYSLGVADRAPGGVFVGYVREVATWITMMILAGVAGSALAADLAARKVREELDALLVLGVDMLRTLILPRVVAMVFSALVLGLLGLLVSIVAFYVIATPALQYTHAAALESIYLNIQPLDLISSFVKHALMGFFIALVACQRGLATRGGAEGVGITVTQTVVVSFFGIWVTNSLWNVGLLTLFPDLLVLKG